ncbi:MAG: hypothetical protein Q3X93_09005, partial [Bifidobacterium sp.]|nr:hypothetical protein [Bifidobacterium sp.]
MNSKKILAAAVSVAAIASLTACGGVKDDTAAGADSGNAITIGTTDKITSLDPAGSYDNGSYAVQIQVFPFLYSQYYNTSELSPDTAAGADSGNAITIGTTEKITRLDPAGPYDDGVDAVRIQVLPFLYAQD